MRLALHFGEPDVDAFAARLSSHQLSEWLAYFRINPLPDPWTQTGILASTVANAFRARGKPATPDDFIPRPKRSPRRQTAGEMKAALLSWADAVNSRTNK